MPASFDQMARVSGFGMTAAADGYLHRPTRTEDFIKLLEQARATGRQITLRGAGRSYGDANIGSECLLVEITNFNQILDFDPIEGTVNCQAGVTLEQIWRHTIESGFWPPVVSGTMFPTLGGALAMNLHGKNAFQAGPIGNHVLEIDVLFPTGELQTLTPADPLFYKVISTAGLLGIILRVKLQLKRITSGDLRVLPISIPNWQAQFAAFQEHQPEADYMVAWVDCLARGKSAGRGLFHAASYTQDPGPTTLRPDHQDLPDTVLGLFPKSTLWRKMRWLLNRPGVRFTNAAKYHASRFLGNGRPHPQSLVGFSFLLDYVPNWRKAYLPGGFIQYQSFVPADQAPSVFPQQIELSQAAKLEPFLGVLKRHIPDQFLFSHGVDGYSLALDFRITERNQAQVHALAHQFNELVLAAGGRFYLAKDSTLAPTHFAQSLGEQTLQTYFELKARYDPDSVLTSNLAHRLYLDPRA